MSDNIFVLSVYYTKDGDSYENKSERTHMQIYSSLDEARFSAEKSSLWIKGTKWTSENFAKSPDKVIDFEIAEINIKEIINKTLGTETTNLMEI